MQSVYSKGINNNSIAPDGIKIRHLKHLKPLVLDYNFVLQAVFGGKP